MTGAGSTGRRGATTAWMARQVLRLYPIAHRRRYGEEMLALLEESPASLRTVLDLLRGALVAHLRPANAPTGVVDPADRVRASTSGVLMCWVFFAAAGFGFYKTTEDAPYSVVGDVHPVLRDAHFAVQALAVIASVAVVLGALPLIAAAVAHARREPAARRLVVLPFAPLLALGAVTAGVLAIAHAQGPHHSSPVGYGIAIIWGIAAVLAATTCVLACRAALFATPVSPAWLRAALACGTVATLSMLAIAAATAAYAVALAVDAAQLAAAPNGPFGLLSTGASLIVQVIVMAGAGVLAATTTIRGWRAA